MPHFVWIDHYQARIFGLTLNYAGKILITDSGSQHYGHRNADHLGPGTNPANPAFLDAVAHALQATQAIIITGPGHARTELANYLNEKFPALATRVWATEPMDHASDAELAATAQLYFRAAERVHQIGEPDGTEPQMARDT